jgi:hypothetical protein
VSDIATPGSEQPTGNGGSNGDDVGTLLVIVNAALIGVPGAYATSKSLVVTAIAAVSAVVWALAIQMRRTTCQLSERS